MSGFWTYSGSPRLEIEEGFLQHVRGIDAPLQPAVHAQTHQPTEAVSITIPYSPQCLSIGAALAKLFEVIRFGITLILRGHTRE